MAELHSFEEMLTGGHPNSLGRTVEVVELVLENDNLFTELFNCYFSKDEVVRLRVSNAMKRLAKERKDLLLPYIDRFIGEISHIDQASTQWTLSQLFLLLEKDLSENQRQNALGIMKRNLEIHQDWIVLSQTMETLGKWAAKDSDLGLWLLPHLDRLELDERKSVSKKASKTKLKLVKIMN
ncbi:MAG: hypothetical protein MRZ79_24215 [Bacteroidia bacterium]|nr:hypothetical protein [Bacteroidia bacterium]